MKTRILLSLIFLPGIVFNLTGQDFAGRSGDELILDNGVIKRIIQLNNDRNGIVSKSMMLSDGRGEFLSAGSDEFCFEADGKMITGKDNWKLIDLEMIREETGGSGATLILDHPAEKIRISISYILYPRLPIIRKRISFENRGINDIKLEALDVERILFRYSGTGTDCWVMNDYARQKSLGQFTGNWYDPVVVVHEVRHHRGIVLGNESPGVMKRTTAFLKPDLLTAGLTHPDQNFGFREWLKPGKVWDSPWVFTGIYENSDDTYAVLNTAVSDYVRRHMGTRLSKIDKKPVFDYIKSKGMKPGVWISLGAAEAKSRVYKEHPEWLVRKAPSGELVANSTGKELAVTGFKVALEKKYDGSLFEIVRKTDK